jgi:mono/diheme cytochrome c family protein
VGDDVMPHYMDAAIEGYELVNEGRTFTPFDETPVPYKQLAGINWPPMSYDVEDHLLYVCANDSVGVVRRTGEQFTPPAIGGFFAGGSWGSVNIPRRGILAALDVTTQKIKWRQQWADPCNSGTVNTAGGLLFIGRRDGRVQALDKRNGMSLWEWQLDAPVSAPVTTFEHRGQQMLAVYAAGGYYSGSDRGDGVWLLSRSGTLKPLPPLTSGAGNASRAGAAVVVADATGGRADEGAKVYQRICEPCHGPTGKGGHAEGAVLPDNVTAQIAMATAMTGKKDMPSFEKVLSQQELKDVAAYVARLLRK